MGSVIGALEQDSQPKRRAVPPDTQQVCIDLPGEEVSCVVYKPKLEIMLRKHRDVIFDLRLFKGMQYTVEADRSDFYNARDKKIVLRVRKQKVTFTDGERLHLWVGRNFTGNLIIKANGKVLGRYNPDEVDCRRYDSEPTTKPAPLIVVMSNEPATAPKRSVATLPLGSLSAPAWSEPYAPLAFSKSHAAMPTETMHVVEVDDHVSTAPQEIIEFFKRGGEETAIDADKLITRNWLWAQIAGAVAYVGDNQAWVRELWKQKFYLQKVKGKVYIIFKGSPGLRSYLTGTRYLTATPKVIAITSGAGTLKGVHKAGWNAVTGGVKGAAKFALIFTIALDAAEWFAAYEERDPVTGKPKRDFYDLGAKVFTDLGWAAIGAAIGTIAMSIGLYAFTAVTGLAAVGGIVVIGAVFAAVVAGYGLAYLDAKFEITAGLASALRETGKYLESKMPRDYSSYDESLTSMMLGGSP